MKRLVGLSLLIGNALAQSAELPKARNIAIVIGGTADGTLIATSNELGPILLKVPGESEITIGLPTGIKSMDDVSVLG
jgi:hypothetical protein